MSLIVIKVLKATSDVHVLVTLFCPTDICLCHGTLNKSGVLHSMYAKLALGSRRGH